MKAMADNFLRQLPDIDPAETQEWIDSLDAVVAAGGRERARYIVAKLLERSNEQQVGVPPTTYTPYINTIPASEQPSSRATNRSSAASADSSGGTRRPW